MKVMEYTFLIPKTKITWFWETNDKWSKMFSWKGRLCSQYWSPDALRAMGLEGSLLYQLLLVTFAWAGAAATGLHGIQMDRSLCVPQVLERTACSALGFDELVLLAWPWNPYGKFLLVCAHPLWFATPLFPFQPSVWGLLSGWGNFGGYAIWNPCSDPRAGLSLGLRWRSHIGRNQQRTGREGHEESICQLEDDLSDPFAQLKSMVEAVYSTPQTTQLSIQEYRATGAEPIFPAGMLRTEVQRKQSAWLLPADSHCILPHHPENVARSRFPEWKSGLCLVWCPNGIWIHAASNEHLRTASLHLWALSW